MEEVQDPVEASWGPALSIYGKPYVVFGLLNIDACGVSDLCQYVSLRVESVFWLALGDPRAVPATDVQYMGAQNATRRMVIYLLIYLMTGFMVHE